MENPSLYLNCQEGFRHPTGAILTTTISAAGAEDLFYFDVYVSFSGTVVEGHGAPIDHQTFFTQLKARGELEDEPTGQGGLLEDPLEGPQGGAKSQPIQQPQQQQDPHRTKWLQDWQQLQQQHDLQQRGGLWDQQQQQQEQKNWERQLHWKQRQPQPH